MQDNKQKSKKKVWKALKMGSPLIIGLSAANSSMLGIVNLVYMILHPMGVTGILLGNIAGNPNYGLTNEERVGNRGLFRL